MIKKILVIFVKTVLVLNIFMLNIGFVKNSIDNQFVNEAISKKIRMIEMDYRLLVENDLELNKIMTEGNTAITNIVKKLLNYTEKNINKLKERVLTLDINKMLKTSVFVRGFAGAGSGTVIKKTEKEMYILTCHHVIDDIIILNKLGLKMGATVGYSKTDDNNKVAGMIIYGAEIIKYDANNDLALLKIFIVDNELEEAKIADKEPNKADSVFSIGNPLGLLRTISQGILVNKQDGFFLSDNTTSYGNSGGGLYNVSGELIGVSSNVMGYTGGLDKEDKETFIPESSLGMSRDLKTIQEFLKGVEF